MERHEYLGVHAGSEACSHCKHLRPNLEVKTASRCTRQSHVAGEFHLPNKWVAKHQHWPCCDACRQKEFVKCGACCAEGGPVTGPVLWSNTMGQLAFQAFVRRGGADCGGTPSVGLHRVIKPDKPAVPAVIPPLAPQDVHAPQPGSLGEEAAADASAADDPPRMQACLRPVPPP